VNSAVTIATMTNLVTVSSLILKLKKPETNLLKTASPDDSKAARMNTIGMVMAKPFATCFVTSLSLLFCIPVNNPDIVLKNGRINSTGKNMVEA
jgi:hypothetical protein